MNYRYYMPTRVIVGKDCIIENSQALALGKKAMVVTGRHSAKANGSLKNVRRALEKEAIDYIIYDQVMTNPTIECAYAGAKVAKDNKVDFVIAIGGGSPMDAAKAMALLATQTIEEKELFAGNYQDALPLVAVPTTAGTGSEVTQYSILTNNAAETKTSIATEKIFPKVAFLDASYMMGLSVKSTINTTIDALSHAVEGMLSVKAGMVSDALAFKSIQMIFGQMNGLKTLVDTEDLASLSLNDREQLANASLMAGMVIAQTGTTAVHAMGYSLTYFKEVDHGRANGLLLGAYLQLIEEKEPKLILPILEAAGLKNLDQFRACLDGLLKEKERITDDEIKIYSAKAIVTGNIKNSKVSPTEDELGEMYRKSLVTQEQKFK